jgi:hypothetical protein
MVDIGDKLSDGRNQKEIEGLAVKVSRRHPGHGGATIAAMREMIAAQEAQAREIAILRSKIRKQPACHDHDSKGSPPAIRPHDGPTRPAA